MRPLIAAVVVGTCVITVAGCTSESSSGPSANDRHAAALRDPMGFKTDVEDRDISGGSLSNFDRGAFKRDMDTFFNP